MPQKLREFLRHGRPARTLTFLELSAIVVEYRGCRRTHPPHYGSDEDFQYGNRPTPDVRSAIQRLLVHLFRRGVRGCHSAGTGRRIGARVGFAARVARARLGQAEIGHFHGFVVGDHNVRRLDVLMNKSLLVSIVQAPGELNRDIEDTGQGFGFVTFVNAFRSNPV